MEADLKAGELIIPYYQLAEHLSDKEYIDGKSAQKADLENFLQTSTHLGHVYAGSRLFSVKESALTNGRECTIRDWALISVVPERIGDNMVSLSAIGSFRLITY